MTFLNHLYEEERVRLEAWLEHHTTKCTLLNAGAIGGRYTFEITPNTLGIVTKVKCACGESEDVTDYKGW